MTDFNSKEYAIQQIVEVYKSEFESFFQRRNKKAERYRCPTLNLNKISSLVENILTPSKWKLSFSIPTVKSDPVISLIFPGYEIKRNIKNFDDVKEEYISIIKLAVKKEFSIQICPIGNIYFTPKENLINRCFNILKPELQVVETKLLQDFENFNQSIPDTISKLKDKAKKTLEKDITIAIKSALYSLEDDLTKDNLLGMVNLICAKCLPSK
jgi:hypothetical protein